MASNDERRDKSLKHAPLVAAVLMSALTLAACSLDEADTNYQEALKLYEGGAMTDAILARLDKAISFNPARIEYYTCRAKVDFDSKRFKDVNADCMRATAVDPNNGFPYYIRGLAECEQSEFSKALGDFNEAIKLNFKRPEYFNGRALAYIGMSQGEAALKDADEAIHLDPHNGRWYYARGVAQMKLNKLKEAQESFDRCIELAPELEYPYAARSALHKMQGHKDLADKDMEKAQKMERDNNTLVKNKNPYRY